MNKKELFKIWKKLMGFLIPFFIISVLLMLAFSLCSAREVAYYLKISNQEPTPIQNVTGNENYKSYVYIDAPDISDWYYLRPYSRASRKSARYYYIVTDRYSDKYVIELTSPIAQETLNAVSNSNFARIEGMTAPLDEHILSGLSQNHPQGLSAEEIKNTCGGIMLTTTEMPSGSAAVIIGIEILFWMGLLAFGILLLRGFCVSVRRTKRNGTIDFVPNDWEIANAYFKNCNVYLGERFIFLRYSGVFFEYADIEYLDPSTKYPTILAVAHLKNGKKVELGTMTKSVGREKMKTELVEAVLQRTKQEYDQ